MIKILESSYGKFIITAIIAFMAGVVLTYYFYPTKTTEATSSVQTNIATNQTVHQVQKPDGTIITDTHTNTTDLSHSDAWSKTEINARKYDLLVFYRYDLDNKTKAIGGQFVFEPFSHILIGAGYERGLQTKSNSLMVLAGLRF